MPNEATSDESADSTAKPAKPSRKDYQWTWPRVLFVGLFLGVILGLLGTYWSRLQAQNNTPEFEVGGGPVTGTDREAFARAQRESMWDLFDTSNLQMPKEQFHSGGVAKDGIPAIAEPESIHAADLQGLGDNSRIVGVTVNGESRAYPIAVLNRHEIVNDTLGGKPIAVTYCPLCDSASVLEREHEGKVRAFGVSGMLINSNVVMYDRTDDSFFSQVAMKSLSGERGGKSLKNVTDWQITSFGKWRSENPDGTVLKHDPQKYGVNPYALRGYFTTDDVWFKFEPKDDRFPNKLRVIGVQIGDVSKAYPLAAIAAEGGQITDIIGESEITLSSDGEQFRIIELPENANLVHTYWFAWFAFHPQTQVFQPDSWTPPTAEDMFAQGPSSNSEY